MQDGRGKFMVSIKKANIEIVKAYMDKNPGALKVDMARDLKMSPITIRKHIASIESELA